MVMVFVILCSISVPVFATENLDEQRNVEVVADNSFYLDVYGDTVGIIKEEIYIPAGYHHIYFSATTPGHLQFHLEPNGWVSENVTSAAGSSYKLFEYPAVEWVFTPYNTSISYSYSFIVD